MTYRANTRGQQHVKCHMVLPSPYLHVLWSITVGPMLELLPLAQVSSWFMQQVTVFGRQQLGGEHDESIDPHHNEVLTWPAHVIVLGALEEMVREKWSMHWQPQGWVRAHTPCRSRSHWVTHALVVLLSVQKVQEQSPPKSCNLTFCL